MYRTSTSTSVSSCIIQLLAALLLWGVAPWVAAVETAAELAASSVDELETHQQQAEAVNNALKKLGAKLPTAVPEAPTTATTVSATTAARRSKTPAARSNVKRNGEASESLVPYPKPSLFAEQRLANIKAEGVQGVSSGKRVSDLQELLANYPNYAEARLLLGRELIAQGNTQQALTVFEPLLQPDNPDWQPWFWAGTARLAQHELASANQNFETATNKNSKLPALWVQLAVLAQERDEQEAALQYLAVAQQLDSNYGQIHLNKAYSLERLGRLKQAREAYQQFLISDVETNSQDLRTRVLRRIGTLTETMQQVAAVPPP